MSENQVTVGSVWFIWGKHHEVIESSGGEVKLCQLDSEGRKLRPDRTWVAAWRILKYGVPSMHQERAR